MASSTRHHFWRTTIILILSIVLLSLLAVGHSILHAHPIRSRASESNWLSHQLATGASPDTDGNLIVFSQDDTFYHLACDDLYRRRTPDASPPDWDVCGYQITSGEIFSIIDSSAYDTLPHVAGEWVVFSRPLLGPPFSTLYAYNLTSGEETEVYSGDFLSNLAIDGEYFVFSSYDPYQETEPEDQMMIYNLRSREMITLALSVSALDIYSNTIVMQHETGVDKESNILGYEIATQETFTISARLGREQHPSIHGDLVVWEWYGGIYGHNLHTGESLTFTEYGSSGEPDVSGNLVVWLDRRRCGTEWDVYAYDLEKQGGGWVTKQPADISNLSVTGELIVWQQDRSDPKIYVGYRATEHHFLPLIR